MTKKELVEKLSVFDDDAEIITFNRTSNRWVKTGSPENYPIETVETTSQKVGDYGKKQLSKFNPKDIAFFF
jgi:hypothetical protein